MAQTATPTPVITGQQLVGMSPQQRQLAVANLTPEEQQRVRTEYADAKYHNNDRFMRYAVRKTAPAPIFGGGFSNTFAQGATLNWSFPTAGGAYARALVFSCNLTITLAAGTGATYGVGVAGPLGIFNQLVVKLNGTHHQIPPYVLQYLSQLNRVGGIPQPSTIIAGTKDTTIESNLNNGGTYPTAVGANTWKFKFRVPLTAIAPTNPAGLLPMMSSATLPTVALTVNSALLGPDPEQNGIIATGGTGNAVSSVGGTITMDVEYLDGQNYWSPAALSVDLSGEPTVQYITDNVTQNIAAGSIQKCRIQSLFQHYAVIAVYMDGTTSGKFVSGLTNIQVLQFAMDSVGQNVFRQYGTGTNIDVFDVYEQYRDIYQQDFAEGVFPWILGATTGTDNPDNRDGLQFLNMTPGGWVDVNHGVQFQTVGVVYPARIATYLVSLNPAGLKVVDM